MAKYELYGIRHTYIEYNNASVLAFRRVWMTKDCEVKIANQMLEFAGDGQKFKRPYGYECEGTVMADIDADDLDPIIFGTANVTPVGPDDFHFRQVRGTDAEMQGQFVGLRITVDGADTDTFAPIVVRFRILRVQFMPDNPGKMASQTVQGRQLTWNARRTTTDIVGTAITGMPARGGWWVKDYITDTTKFDPVPGDIL
jgi:hypothetical protein